MAATLNASDSSRRVEKFGDNDAAITNLSSRRLLKNWREEVLKLLFNKQSWIVKNFLGIPQLRTAD